MRLLGLQEQCVRTLIRDTIETYPGQWRLVHEPVQNSHDAIQLNEAITEGLIAIDLHVGQNSVVITDNGRGVRGHFL